MNIFKKIRFILHCKKCVKNYIYKVLKSGENRHFCKHEKTVWNMHERKILHKFLLLKVNLSQIITIKIAFHIHLLFLI